MNCLTGFLYLPDGLLLIEKFIHSSSSSAQMLQMDSRSKRHVLRRQIRHLHRSAAEISSFSLPAVVSRGEIDFTSLRTKILLSNTTGAFGIWYSNISQPARVILTAAAGSMQHADAECSQPCLAAAPPPLHPRQRRRR
jgi:hypothetical protein